MRLPEDYARRMETILAAENLNFAAFTRAAEKAPVTGLRANALKISPNELAGMLGAGFSGVPWCAEGFYTDEAGDARRSKSPLFAAGLYYLQEPSAMCPAALLNPPPGARVLDLCAAPGGKTAQLAASLRGAGFLLANDISPSRCKALLRNLNRAGVRGAVVSCEAPERLARVFGGYFNRVLADAPCSGEGMFRRDAGMMKRWQGGAGNPFPPLQADILRAAACMTAPGGRLVYSTCTFNTDENEAVVRRFLSEHGDFSLVPLPHAALGIDPGIALAGDARLRGCGRIWPHRQRGEGHFMALMERSAGLAAPPAENTPAKGTPPTPEDMRAWRAFESEALVPGAFAALPGVLHTHESSLFLLPEGAPEMPGLRLMSSGFYLGDFKNGRFAPSQAFAMGITPDMAKGALRFGHGDARVARYLRGESLDVGDMDAEDGWRLACLERFPLGWGRLGGGRLKNKIEKWMIE